MTTEANIKQYEPRTFRWSNGQDSALPMQGGAEQSGQQSLGREKLCWHRQKNAGSLGCSRQAGGEIGGKVEEGRGAGKWKSEERG